ncbi:MAG: adenylate/guanylate cyclase domain-containing protein [Candidatus Riflebacteria bacterium]|nr:adenylate/guanylate cyclase domain-containing protein [Candidatus Riflebacteria bacterium]
MRLFRFKRLQSRLFFIFVSLFLIVGFSSFLVLSRVHESNARNKIETDLTLSANVLAKLISIRLENHSKDASILSKDYAFQQAFSTNDLETVSSGMESLKRRINADLMMMMSIEEGHKVLVDTSKSNWVDHPFPYLDLISRTEESGEPQTAFIAMNNQLYSVIIVPMLAPEPLAWFCIGFRVDDRFLRDFRQLMVPDMSILQTPVATQAIILATTLAETERKLFADCLPEMTTKKGIVTVLVNNERFLVLTKLLDEKAGIWLMVQNSLEQALQPFFKLQRILLGITFAGLLMTTWGVVLISRDVSKPLKEMVEKTRVVEKGIYDQHVTIDLEDEIGELAKSFNRMTDGLAERERIHDLLGKVVSSAIADELLKSKELKLGGEEKEATILFSDIRDFTTLCEGRAPADVLQLLNQYLTRMNDIIEINGGVVDKFIGDSIMAIFGVPIRHDDDPDRALKSALAMLEELDRFNQELMEKGSPPIHIGIGINTDVIVAGNMGSRNRLNYTVIGDGVNLASRLESQSKSLKRIIIVSEATLQKAHGSYQTEFMGEVTVKGKSEPTRVFALLGKNPQNNLVNNS